MKDHLSSVLLFISQSLLVVMLCVTCEGKCVFQAEVEVCQYSLFLPSVRFVFSGSLCGSVGDGA